jgi:hypothetical protein
MRLLLLYQELALLKEFEKRDVELTGQQDIKRAEKSDIVAKVCVGSFALLPPRCVLLTAVAHCRLPRRPRNSCSVKRSWLWWWRRTID